MSRPEALSRPIDVKLILKGERTGTGTASKPPLPASTIQFKILMAVSGFIFISYVIGHLYGNLRVYAGQEAFDGYAHHLRVLGAPILPHGGFLWIARSVLLASLIGHVVSAIKLWRRAAAARTTKYVAKRRYTSSVSSRTMRWGGVTLLLFLVFHLAHLTTRSIRPDGNSSSPYERVIGSFQPSNWWVIAIYLAAQCALGMHLHHGCFSAMQTMGMTSTVRRHSFMKRLSATIGILVPLGFASIPIAVLTGMVN